MNVADVFMQGSLSAQRVFSVKSEVCTNWETTCTNLWTHDMQALVKYLDNVSDEDIPSLEIPTGVPLIYELDENLKPIKHYYVG